jgi:hypothetical protein
MKAHSDQIFKAVAAPDDLAPPALMDELMTLIKPDRAMIVRGHFQLESVKLRDLEGMTAQDSQEAAAEPYPNFKRVAVEPDKGKAIARVKPVESDHTQTAFFIGHEIAEVVIVILLARQEREMCLFRNAPAARHPSRHALVVTHCQDLKSLLPIQPIERSEFTLRIQEITPKH